MAKNERGVKVYAVNNGNATGFNIYLEFHGQSEFLMWHRHNGFLYNLLRNGVRLDELRRMTGRDRKGVKYLLAVIDEYIAEEKEEKGA